MLSFKFKLVSDVILHLRPATIICSSLNNFDANVKIIVTNEETKEKREIVPSALLLMTLGVGPESIVEVVADGKEEKDVISNLKKVMNELRDSTSDQKHKIVWKEIN
jgi:phosphotransferase system HPr (HPr) family protein